MKNFLKKYGSIIFAAIFVIVLIPILIDWLIIGNCFPSNIENSDWVGFLGSYVGAIIGAVVSLAGIAITIRYTNDQNKKDRELQVRPYCTIRYEPNKIGKLNEIRDTDKMLMAVLCLCDGNSVNGINDSGVLYLKNVGLGPMIEFELNVFDIQEEVAHPEPTFIFSKTYGDRINVKNVNYLSPGETAIIPLRACFNFKKIREEDILVEKKKNDDIDGEFPEFKLASTAPKYIDYDIMLELKYRDIFRNQFKQEIVFQIKHNISYFMNGEIKHASYYGTVILKEDRPPIKIKN